MLLLHQLPDARELFEIVAAEQKLLPIIVEKDYWIMHCLWGLQQQGYKFDLKGGTSLSKGFNIIERFSEDIDIQIYPNSIEVKTGKNQNKTTHIESRRAFFEQIANNLHIPNMKFSRDNSFDDPAKMRSGGIRGEYDSFFSKIPGLKEGLVLEVGFDQTVPNVPCDVTSWVYEKAKSLNLNIIDNSAKDVLCYLPEYTFVEKLQAISTKYRLQQETQSMPVNFLRHYYDIYKLLEAERVLKFIGTKEYQEHKKLRFRESDEFNVSKNLAFIIPDARIRNLYTQEFKSKSAIYFGKQLEFEEILSRIKKYIELL